MKIWIGFGSEHSMNLVMVGTFSEVADAAKAKELIESFTDFVQREIDDRRLELGGNADRYSDEALEFLSSHNVHNIGPQELEQFAYDVTTEVRRDEVVLTTDEIEVSAFVKLLLKHGARIEIYSAHDYPGTGHGRGG